jgi:hypothetical protein
MKHTSWKRSLILVILFSLLFNACGTSTQNQINQRVSATLTAEAQLVQSQQRKAEEYMDKYGFIPITTQDPDFAVAAIARNGEKLISMTETDSQGNITNVKGAIWVSPDDEVIVVYLNEDGLPDRLIVQEYVFLFSNYSGSTVDIAIISPSGSISVSRNVSIELEKLSNYHSFSPKFDSVSLVSMKNRAFSWAEALEWTSIIMGITSCAGSIAATAATAGGLIPFLVASCGSLLCDLVNFILPEDNEFLEATSLVGNTFGCVIDF